MSRFTQELLRKLHSFSIRPSQYSAHCFKLAGHMQLVLLLLLLSVAQHQVATSIQRSRSALLSGKGKQRRAQYLKEYN